MPSITETGGDQRDPTDPLFASTTAEPPAGAPPWTGDPVDLWWDSTAPESAWSRSDGHPLIYASAVNTIYARPGVGKTWVALMILLDWLRDGKRAIWWNFDSFAGDLGERVTTLGGRNTVIDSARQDLFRYQQDSPEWFPESRADMVAWLAQNDAGLLIIDTMSAAGCAENGDSISEWWQRFVKPFQDANCTLLLVDHTTKSVEVRTRGGIGSQAKLALITGVALYADGVCWTRNTAGAVHLTVDKDRRGAVGPQGARVSTIAGWWDQLGGFRFEAREPDERDSDGTGGSSSATTAKILGVLADGPASVQAIVESTGLPKSTVYRLLGALGERVQKLGRGRWGLADGPDPDESF